jgi:hypothetical protein
MMTRIINAMSAAGMVAAGLLSGATPSIALPIAPHARHATHHHITHRRPYVLRHAFGGPFLSIDSDRTPGSWHVNGNGLPYQVPYPCAYPIGADSGGAEQFQMFGCPLP